MEKFWLDDQLVKKKRNPETVCVFAERQKKKKTKPGVPLRGTSPSPAFLRGADGKRGGRHIREWRMNNR